MSLLEKMNDISSWFYRGEGNDTLVVGLKGQNLVLRLKKSIRQELKESRSTNVHYMETITNSLDFSKNVFLPLMAGKYVRVGEFVPLPDGLAGKLDILCEPYRPKHRIHKGIDANTTFTVIMADFCFLPEGIPWIPSVGVFSKVQEKTVDKLGNSNPTYSIEIKPKCGFLPCSPHIRKDHLVKHSICYYCMLQGVKVAEGKYARASRYCPVNLFSFEPKRVFYALKALVTDPQNNIRIFKDGSPVFTEEILQQIMRDEHDCCPMFVLEKTLQDAGWKESGTSTLNTHHNHKCNELDPCSRHFMEILLKILVHDSKTGEQNTQRSVDVPAQVCQGNGLMSHSDEDMTFVNEIGFFGHGGVLQLLLGVQKMDDMDVEGLYPDLYLKVKRYFDTNAGERAKFSVDGPYSATIWNAVSKTNSLDDNHDTELLSQKPAHSWSMREIIFKLCQFSVASTAKDSSIMLTFQQQCVEPSHLPFIELTTESCNKYIVYNIDLVDWDPKEFDRVEKYYKDSCKAVKHFLQP